MRLRGLFISVLLFVLLMLIAVRCEIRRVAPIIQRGRQPTADIRGQRNGDGTQTGRPDGGYPARSHFQLHGCHDHAVQGEGTQRTGRSARGDEISFQLQVTETESWVDHIAKIGTVSLPPAPAPTASPAARPNHPLLDYKFTNELGQAVSLNDFRGQALAITFFYTRCPLPDYCPRLSKNFQEAQQKLETLARRSHQLASAFHFL